MRAATWADPIENSSGSALHLENGVVRDRGEERSFT